MISTTTARSSLLPVLVVFVLAIFGDACELSVDPQDEQEVTAPPSFDDVADTTHEDDILAVAGEGIADGYDDDTFRPEDPVTRGQMATFLTRALDLEDGQEGRFDDVVGSAHEEAVLAVADAGIADGFGDGTFRPGDEVTRGQMAAFLSRALDLEGGEPDQFVDVEGTTHADAIAAVAAEGIADGYDDDTFRPDDAVTRGQMAAFLARALELD